MSKSDLVDLTLFIHHETDAAYRASYTGHDKDAVWLPKSHVEIETVPRPGERVAIFPAPSPRRRSCAPSR